jgi:glyoxylate reductase
MLHDRIDDAVLAAAGPQLRIVANVAVGYDNIEVGACGQRGIVVSNTPGVLVDATADQTMALMLAVTRRLAEGDRLLRSRQPWSWSMTFMLGTGLQGLRLGIVGFGRIGQAVAARAAAFGMEIQYSTRAAGALAAPAATAGVPGLPAAVAVSFEELVATSDVVTLHCPLTPETRHLVDAGVLRAMRPTAYLVNTARGPIVDEAALADALAAGEIAGAALDVFEEEPAVHPGLLALDNVVLAPHLGSATSQTRAAMALLAAENVVEVLSGRPPVTPVPPAGAWPPPPA